VDAYGRAEEDAMMDALTISRGKLPVDRLVGAAYAAAPSVARGMIASIGGWFVLLLVMMGLLHWFLWPLEIMALRRGESGSKTIIVFATIIGTLAMASLTVDWTRLILVGRAMAIGKGLRIDAPVQRCYAAALLLTGTWLIPFLCGSWLLEALLSASRPPTSTQTSVVSLFMTASLLGLWLSARLSLILSPLALGMDHITLAEIWRRTNGSHIRLLTGAAACLTPAIVTRMVLAAAMPERPSRLEFVVYSCASEIAVVLLSMIWIGFLAIAWQHFFAEEI
jgi:hypothetical protein